MTPVLCMHIVDCRRGNVIIPFFLDVAEAHLNELCRTYPSVHYESAYSAFVNTANDIYNGQVDLMLTGQTKNLMELVSSIEWFGPYMAKKNTEFEADYHVSDKIQIKVPRRKGKKLKKLKTIKLISRPSTRSIRASKLAACSAVNTFLLFFLRN